MAIVKAVGARIKKLEGALHAAGFRPTHSQNHGDVASWGYQWSGSFQSSEGGNLTVDFYPNATD